jgi:hypothetical protein
VKQRFSDEQLIDALRKDGGLRSAAARSLGVSVRSVHSRIDSLRANGVDVPESTYTGKVAGTSTLYGADGSVKLTWVKEKNEGANPEQWAEIVRDVFTGTDRVKPIPAPPARLKELLTVYPIGDHHTAMYSWAEETGEDYDIKTAERLLVSAVTYLVDLAPPSETALIVNLGDFFHVDQHRPETTRSHNSLDVDTRYAGMIRAGVAMMRACIDAALAKHRKVRVINACGNHDDIGALWLSLAMSLLYEKNPRVEIDTSPSKFAYHQHGQVLLGVTHGDTAKLDKLAGVMAADRPALWGTTKHRHWLTGHIHQRRVIEQPGCMVESFRTLAARDAWATAAGYRSGRDMTALVFHAAHGEVARHRFDVGMLQ